MRRHTHEINELEKRQAITPDAAVEEELAELRTAAELLQVVDKQTTVSDHANPVRAMGFVAEPAVLSVIMSILVATLYIEVQKVFETIFYAASDNSNVDSTSVLTPSSSNMLSP